MGKTYRDIHKANYNKFWDTRPEDSWRYGKRHSTEYVEWWSEHNKMWSLHNKDTWRYVAYCNRLHRIDGDYGLQRGWTREKIIDRETKKELEHYINAA